MKRLPATCCVLLCIACAPGHGMIAFRRDANAIRITDYPRDVPCTLDNLLLADRMNGWGKVTYDAKTDTCVLDANLWIGDNDRTETFVRIGVAARPRETLLVRGDVVVWPYYVPGENPKPDWRPAETFANNLTIGDETDPAIRPTLKIHSEPGAEHSIYLGCTPRSNTGLERGGQLHVFNGAVTAAVQDEQHAIGAPGKHRVVHLRGQVILKNATYSWAADKMAYGLRNAVLENTTFEHAGTAILGRRHKLVGCVFRRLGTALLDYGDLDVTAVDCTFENNRRNWCLRFTDKGLTCIDCSLGQPGSPNEYHSWVHPQTSRKRYPWFVSRRHIVVEVVNAAGEPVEGALVKVVAAPDAPETVTNGEVRTDPSGRTPGKGQPGAILLTEIRKQATDAPNRPTVTEYSYRITVNAPGLPGTTLNNLRPTTSWQLVRVQLP